MDRLMADLAGFVALLFPTALVVAVVLIVVQRAEPEAPPDHPRPSAATTARRTYVYLGAFAGLLASLLAISGLLALLAERLTLSTSNMLGGDLLRQQTSFYLAALVVGAPVWLGHWAWAQRLVARLPGEDEAYQRRLFLAAVFAVTGVVTLFGLEGTLRFVLTLPGGATAQPDALGGIMSGARLLTFGVAWWGYARLGAIQGAQTERGPDHPRDVGLYVVAGFALAMLAFGAYVAVQELTGLILRLTPVAQPALLSASGVGPWVIWGSVAAQLLAGGGVWLGVWQYDLSRGGRRLPRTVYLYLVLLTAVPATLVGATDGLYELARRIFGYQNPYGGSWDYLRDVLPLVVVGAVAWAYHWSVMRQQRRPAPAAGAAGADPAGAIPWPRRPALFLLALLGLAGASAASIAIVWVALDALVNSAATISTADWWRDRLSLGIAALLVGAIAWLTPWSIVQRAATAAPGRERPALARRLYLGIVVLAAALAAFGFLIALIWLLAQAALGEPVGAAGYGRAVKDAATVIVAAGLAGGHAALFRRDAREGVTPRHALHLVAVLAPQSLPTLAALRQQGDLQIDILGELEADGITPQYDRETLQQRLAAMATAGENDHALLILHPNGGTLYPYRPRE